MAASRAITALAFVFLVTFGGVVYFTYSANYALSQQNASLNSRLNALQTDFNSYKANITSIQNEMAMLRSYRLAGPMVLLRTWGAGLASYGERHNGLTYLRLTETGPNSGVEASLAASPFNATVAGASLEWSAFANKVATDSNHTIWPMVLENSPAGTDAIEFEMKGGHQEVAVNSNGIRFTVPVFWDVNVPHLFKIVVVTPGVQVDFYIDGKLAASITAYVPKSGFFLRAAEVKADTPQAAGVATLDVYGGQNGG